MRISMTTTATGDKHEPLMQQHVCKHYARNCPRFYQRMCTLSFIDFQLTYSIMAKQNRPSLQQKYTGGRHRAIRWDTQILVLFLEY